MELIRSRLTILCRPHLIGQSKRFASGDEWKLRHYYNTLQVRPCASPEEIRENYIELVKIYHPDNPETGDKTKFMRIQESYKRIKAAPLWLSGDVGKEALTHEEFIKTHRVDNISRKELKWYDLKRYTAKLYRSG